MGRTIQKRASRKVIEPLPHVTRVRKGSRKNSTSTRCKKVSMSSQVDIVDVSSLTKPCRRRQNTGSNKENPIQESVFLEFVDSSEEIPDLSIKPNLRFANIGSVSFLTKNLKKCEKKGIKNSEVEAEIVVVDQYLQNDDQLSSPHDMSDDLLTPVLNDDVLYLDENMEENLAHLFEEKETKFVLCRKEHITVLVISHPFQICFKGRATIRCLLGSCEILGYELEDNDNRSYDIISPKSNSYLTITTQSGGLQNEVGDVLSSKNIFNTANIEELLCDMKQLSEGECVVLVCERLNSHLLDYLVTLPSYKDLFKMDDDSVRYSFSTLENSGSLCVSVSHQYKTALQDWSERIKNGEQPVVMVVGGKNTGKSTLNRMLINSALNVTDSVCFMDCDVGQAEFTPPGFVSLHSLSTPVIGPPFSHQLESGQLCYFGEITPSKGLSRYIRSVQYVHNLYKQQKNKLPLVINTLGWNEGLGIKIIIDLIHIMRPSIVLQLEGEFLIHNFPTLTSDFLVHTSGWLYNIDSSWDTELPNYNEQSLYTIDSEVPMKHKSLYKAAEYRELATISCLNKGLNVGTRLLHMNPFKIHFKDLALHDCQYPNNKTQILYIMNASVVALCVVDMTESYQHEKTGLRFFKETPVCSSVGLGIVRAIDVEQKLLYLITPISVEKLANVNCLMKGAVQLPNVMFFEQLESIDVRKIPYLGSVKKSIGSAALNIRSKMPRKQYTRIVKKK